MTPTTHTNHTDSRTRIHDGLRTRRGVPSVALQTRISDGVVASYIHDVAATARPRSRGRVATSLNGSAR